MNELAESDPTIKTLHDNGVVIYVCRYSDCYQWMDPGVTLKDHSADCPWFRAKTLMSE